MNGLNADLAGLDGCRRVMGNEAGQFGGISDGFASRGVDASIFGKLPASGQIARQAQQMNTAGRRQFSAAENFLRAVERGLDQTQGAIVSREKADVGDMASTPQAL